MKYRLKNINEIADTELKNKIVEKYRFINTDDFIFWLERNLEVAQIEEILKENHLEPINIKTLEIDMYHRTHNFNLEIADTEAFIKKLKEDYPEDIKEIEAEIYKIVEEEEAEGDPLTGYYPTAEDLKESVSEIFYDSVIEGFESLSNPRSYSETLENLLSNIYAEIETKIFNILNEFYESDMEDQAVIETLQANEFLFDSTGSIVIPFEA